MLMLRILRSVQNQTAELLLSAPADCLTVIANWVFNYQQSQFYTFHLIRTPDYSTAVPGITKNNFHSLKSSRISRIRRCAEAFGFGVPLALTAQLLFSGGTRHTAGREKLGHRCRGETCNG